MRRLLLLPLAGCLGLTCTHRVQDVPHVDLPLDAERILIGSDVEGDLLVCLEVIDHGTPCKTLTELRRDYARIENVEAE